VADIVTEPKNPGDDLVVKVLLINFGSSGTVNANLEYTISDSDGNVVKQFSDVIPVTTQTEYLDYINTSGLMIGTYKLNIALTYAGQTDPASAEKTFYIGGALRGFLNGKGLGVTILTIAMMGLLLLVYAKTRRVANTDVEANNAKNPVSPSNESKNKEKSKISNATGQSSIKRDAEASKEDKLYASVLKNMKEVAAYDTEIKNKFNLNSQSGSIETKSSKQQIKKEKKKR